MVEFDLNREEKRLLLRAARAAIQRRLSGGDREEVQASGALAIPCGAFVTLHLRKQLRGCIGHLESDQSLLETVERMAVAAASDDPRFPPLSDAELPEIELEISALSPLWPATDWSEFEVGEHGVLLRKGFHQAVFLPQVAPEQGWDAETTLTHLALKAGLPAEAWREPDCRFQLFTAIVFSEGDA